MNDILIDSDHDNYSSIITYLYVDLDNNNNIWSAKQINVNVILGFFTNVQEGDN